MQRKIRLTRAAALGAVLGALAILIRSLLGGPVSSGELSRQIGYFVVIGAVLCLVVAAIINAVRR